MAEKRTIVSKLCRGGFSLFGDKHQAGSVASLSDEMAQRVSSQPGPASLLVFLICLISLASRSNQIGKQPERKKIKITLEITSAKKCQGRFVL